jgi:hypothetical protein
MEMKGWYVISPVVTTATLLALIGTGNGFAQIAPPLNSQPAIPLEPANLAEAAGRYVAAVEFLSFLKGTVCGYALTREVPNYETVVNQEVAGYFPASQRKEVAGALLELKSDVTTQAHRMFESFYSYYTKTEKLDGKTSCGFIVGSAITTRKVAAELFLRKVGQR